MCRCRSAGSGNLSVGDDGESHIDRPGAGGVLKVIHLAERQAEGEDAVLAIEQGLAAVAGLHAAERQRAANGPVQRVDARYGVAAVGYYVGVPAHLDVSLFELVNYARSVDTGADEDRMLLFCSSRTILTAVSLSGAAPRIAANPGMRPSTSWIPSVRRIVSVKKPLQSGCGSSLFR